MGAASVSEYAASLNEQQQQPVNAFIHFMNTNYPQLTNKISFSMPMWLIGKKMSEGYVAVSAAKNHFSIHFSDEEFLNRLTESLRLMFPPSGFYVPANAENAASTSNTAMSSRSIPLRKASATS